MGNGPKLPQSFLTYSKHKIALLGPETLDTAKSAKSLARISYLMRNLTRARELLDFAWKQMHKLGQGNTHQAMLRNLYNLGVLNREEGFHGETLELLEHASELQLAFCEVPRNHDYLLCQIALAELKNECEHSEEAITISERWNAPRATRLHSSY